MAIYITGDCHAQIDRFSFGNFAEGKLLTKDDYVIILGDFGLIWDHKGESEREKYWLKWLNDKPWTTLFIDGNHENYTRLNAFPVSEWNGGKVHFIRPSIIHLMRGQTFTIEGKTFYTLGGANSHDIQHGIIDPSDYVDRDEMRDACRKLEREHGGWQFAMYRILGESWWPQEVPSVLEIADGEINLASRNFEVDYVLTHDAPSIVIPLLSKYGIEEYTEYEKYLSTLAEKLTFKHWYFGHFHLDRYVSPQFSCHYETISRIN